MIKFDKPEEEPNVYLLWGDDSASDQKSKHLTYIPPPKLKLPGLKILLTNLFICLCSRILFSVVFDLYNFVFPGHEESYNPSLEYIPTEEEKAAYELMYEEDRPKFIPKRYSNAECTLI